MSRSTNREKNLEQIGQIYHSSFLKSIEFLNMMLMNYFDKVQRSFRLLIRTKLFHPYSSNKLSFSFLTPLPQALEFIVLKNQFEGPKRNPENRGPQATQYFKNSLRPPSCTNQGFRWGYGAPPCELIFLVCLPLSLKLVTPPAPTPII